MKLYRIILSLIFIAVQGNIFNLWAQSNDIVWVNVTYYDFHSDGSNANFNKDFTSFGLFKGMVKDNLSPDSKPLLNNILPVMFNDRVEEWFRPSGAGPEAVFNADENRWTGLIPYNGKTDEWVSQNFNPTSDMASIVIYDSLPLTKVDAHLNIYGYTNETFFPLSDKGFGNEETQFPDRNYSFTMEIHTHFRYLPQERQFFQFYGDDDVWVFINGKLALDIGGIHESTFDIIEFDQNTARNLGLEPGKVYPMDFFFAERNVSNSYIQFQTNLITVRKNLAIDVTPGDTIKAGETAKCVAYFMTDTGNVFLTELSGNVEWEFEDLNANNPKSILESNHDTAWVTPIQAYTTLKVTARYKDSETDLSASVNIVVIPNDPDHIVIEASYEKPRNEFLWKDNPMDTTAIAITEISVDNFYGILRDTFSNWIGPADPVTWSSGDKLLLKTESGPKPEYGQGKAIRQETASDTVTTAIAEYSFSGKILKDDILVKILYLASIFTNAEYYETDSRPDGLIDVVRITTDGNITISEDFFEDFYHAIRLPEYRKFTFDKTSFRVINNGFEILVKQPVDIEPFTGTDDRDIITFKKIEYPETGIFPEQTIVIKDKLGPVINRAVFAGTRPGLNTKKDMPDTLEVFYSEKVFIPKVDEPFEFCYRGDNKKLYTMKLDLNLISGGDKSDVMKFLVLSKTKQYPEQGDSIWIRSGKKVIDTVNIAQDSATTGRPLEVRYPLDAYIHALGPYILGDPVPAELSNEPGRKGAVILIEIDGFITDHKSLKTTCNLYDPLGNTIQEDLKSYYKEIPGPNGNVKRFFVFVWDCRNRYSRNIHPGAYFGIVSISRNGLVLRLKKVYIGIKGRREKPL